MATKIKKVLPKILTEEELEYNVLYKNVTGDWDTLYLKVFDNERGTPNYRIVWFENGRAGVSIIKNDSKKYVVAPVGTQLLLLLLEQYACILA